MPYEIFYNIIYPSIKTSLEAKGFEPSLISNKAMRDGIYIVLSPESDYPSQSEKQFRDAIIDLLTRLHIPFEDESDGLCTYIFINLAKLNLQEINND